MRKLIRRLLWAFGYDVQRVENTGSSSRLTYDLALLSQATTLLDVGANEGQSAIEFLGYFPNSKIISFEPLSKAHAIASEKSKNYPNWKMYPRTALGNETGEVSIHIAGNSVSSSLFEMKKLHSDSAPESANIGQEKTPVIRLDQALQTEVKNGERYYLKVDTQGFELNVLNGATEILDRVVAVQVELSWGELYSGQPLANEVIQWLLDHGFQPYGFAHVFRDSKTHSLLQMDGFFLKVKA